MLNPNSVAVIMRSKNSDWVIGQSLKGLFSQEYTQFELIVVDSGSTDKTLDIVKQYPCRLIEIPAEKYYPGEVLNSIIEKISAEIIVFLNSDAVPLTPYTLGRVVSTFDDPGISAVFARQLPRPEADTWVNRDYEISFPDTGTAPDWMAFSLPLAAFRRTVWAKHHFYTDAWGSEDTEWGAWAKQNGYSVKYLPDALVMHSHNYTLRQLYGRRFIEGEADAFIYNSKFSAVDIAVKCIKSSLNDLIYYIKKRDFWGIPEIPFRRAVYQWAYYKGNKLGWQRKASGSQDASIGQKTVLERYDVK